MSENRWQLKRAGLINFWYYDDEAFEFEDGKLLLRGSNGSGKSVTMQSLIPLLLDGNKSPERLDPFGSKARKIENYLLGEDEAKDESIGYLYLEFKKENIEQYITIGMGLKAKKGSPVKSWGFSITDGRRVGHDFYLYKDGVDKIPLTMKELQNRLGIGGQVLENQGDYKKHINDILFGFNDIDEYDELIKLLVQLRTPKLSKDFKPSVIYEIMENSLQPLSEDDLRPMSEAIENMDNIKSKFDELKESKAAIDKIKASFDKYNEFMLYDKAKLFIDSKKALNDQENLKQKLYEEIEQRKTNIENIVRDLEHLTIEYTTNERKRIELENNDSVKVYEKLTQLEEEAKDLERQSIEKNDKLEKKLDKDKEYQQKLKDNQNKQEELNGKLKQILSTLDDYADEFSFEEQSFLTSELLENVNKEYRFNYVKDQLIKYKQSLTQALESIQKQESLNKEYNEVLKLLDESKTLRSEKGKYLEQCQTVLEETKDEYIEKLVKYNKENQEMIISSEQLVLINREVKRLNENSQFENLNTLLRDSYYIKNKVLNLAHHEWNSKLTQIQNEVKNKQDEIIEWEIKKEPEPYREDKVIQNRKNLQEANIPFVPFYLTIDFKDIDLKLKGKLEEALMDMGLLDALVIPNEYKDTVLQLDKFGADKYLFSNPELLNHTIDAYFEVSSMGIPKLSQENIYDILNSILVTNSNESAFIDEAGNYGIGLIKGKTSGSILPKFIGSASRNRYKEEMILNLKKELDILLDSEKLVQSEIDGIHQRLSILEKEYASKPSTVDLEVAMSQVKDASYNYQKSEEEVKILTEKEKTAYQKLKKINEEVYQLTHKISLSINTESYKNAIDYANEYQTNLYELEKTHIAYLQTIQTIDLFTEEYESNLQTIDDLQYDLGRLERKLKEAKVSIGHFEDQLKLTDFEAIKNELETCVKRLREIPDQKIQLAADQREIEIKVDIAKEKLETVEKQLVTCQIEFDYYQKLFVEENNLGYLYNNTEEKDPLIFAKKLLKDIDINSIRDKDKLVSNLYEKYQLNSPYLRDYFIQINRLFPHDESLPPYLKSGERLNIVGKVRGKEVNLYLIIEFIEESMDECQNLLREKDRELFEDILVNNISKKIRAKIYHSEKWVSQMNDLMESMNTSSGLKFSLKWSSKKAESEDQMDSIELVELLKLDGHLMKQQDIEKLSLHFRSKLNEARRVSQDNDDHRTFHLIIKEILDYRRWFEFKLFFIKTGQNKKELTNNAFFQFSGGEKAMAMYVPLFSAVFAKYEGARKNCPKLISLDEAFAGVDEKNIRDMFRLLSELNFDFIINSQILWGDYDTIQSLAICELIRYDNADFVTVLRYKWNGYKKELVV